MSDKRSIKISARVMALPEDEVHTCGPTSYLASQFSSPGLAAPSGRLP
jgi:hypothetical protein